MSSSSHQYHVLRLFTKARMTHFEMSNSFVGRGAGVPCSTVQSLLSGRRIGSKHFEKLASWNGLSLDQIDRAAARLVAVDGQAAA